MHAATGNLFFTVVMIDTCSYFLSYSFKEFGEFREFLFYTVLITYIDYIEPEKSDVSHWWSIQSSSDVIGWYRARFKSRAAFVEAFVRGYRRSMSADEIAGTLNTPLLRTKNWLEFDANKILCILRVVSFTHIIL